VILVAVKGQFGTGGSITLTSSHNLGSHPAMGVIGARTPYAITATFPSENPGDGLSGEQFTITVPGQTGDIVISPVNIFSLDGEGGYPPTM
jgi:hypothetical protein